MPPAFQRRLLAAGAFALCLPAFAALAGTVHQTNIVSDGVAPAKVIDKTLVNPWGISFSPNGPFWLSDNGTGIAPVYGADGSFDFSVTVPPPPGQPGPSAPTGQVFNSTTGFKMAGGKAIFMFATEGGTIAGWNGGTATLVDGSAKRAVYKGLALAHTQAGAVLLTANFRSGRVEVYDETFKLVRSFRDARLPPRYAPFNVAVLGARIYVAYALTDGARHDDVRGSGHGYIDEVTAEGVVVKRLISKGPLNSPWGMAIAPAAFGELAGSLLVGNFGDGRIHAFSPATGRMRGVLLNAAKRPLVIDGLWALQPGNGGSGGAASKVYFTAGPGHEQHGIFGSLTFERRASEADDAATD